LKTYLVVLVAAIALAAGSSCKKTGVNQNLNPDNQKPVDFMSTKNGSYWKYGTRDGVLYTRHARDMDTMKNGLKFSYYEREDDITGTISPEYFGKNGAYHFTLIDLDGSRTSYLEYAFWKDSAKKGDTWNNVGSVTHELAGKVDLLVESTQSDDGLTLTFGGNTFTNVVHVHSDIKAINPISLRVGTFDIWFVKGLGVIREEANIDIAGFYTQTHTDSLLSYHIEP
jgi:hypothetical protein